MPGLVNRDALCQCSQPAAQPLPQLACCMAMAPTGWPQQGSQHLCAHVTAGRRKAGAPGIEAVQRATGRTLKMAWGWKTTRSAASTDTCTTSSDMCHSAQKCML